MQKIYRNYQELDASVGKRVRVEACNVRSYEIYGLIGDYGTIVNYRASTGYPCSVTAFAIEIIGKRNPKSESGVFWISPLDLTIVNKTDKINKSEESEMSVKLDKGAKIAMVKNPNPQRGIADYPVVYYDELKVNDLVVLMSRGNIEVGVVTRLDVDPEVIGILEGEVMGIADTTAYAERKQRRERRAELKEKMIEQAKKYQEEQYWKTLAESDPAMKALYDEFKGLEG